MKRKPKNAYRAGSRNLPTLLGSVKRTDQLFLNFKILKKVAGKESGQKVMLNSMEHD